MDVMKKSVLFEVNKTKMLIELAEFNLKLQMYRRILKQLQDEQEMYHRMREQLSKLSQRRRSEVQKPNVVCYMCNANIRVEDTNSFASCRGCERLVCRSEEKRCCEWIPAIGIWECQTCHSNRVIHQRAGEWLLNQLTSRLQNPSSLPNLKNDVSNATDSDDAHSSTSSISTNQKIKVREFIEEMLSSMLDGPLDDVSVGQLGKNESYLKVFHRYHSRLSRCLYNLELAIHQSLSDLPLREGQKTPDSPSEQHFELRKLLQRILDEVARLPELLNQNGLPQRPEEYLPYFNPKKYEQLLATAVLNKVVENYRNPKNFEHVEEQQHQLAGAEKTGPPTTGATSAGSALATETTSDINHNTVSGKSQLNAANLRRMSLNAEEFRSKEELYDQSLSESDESYLSDYIQKHTVPLPDLSDATGSGPEDDLASVKSNNTDGTWEENWLFRKRQLKSTEASIAMLVPSPTEEVKALIGDKNADEVSDLSEAGSDIEEYDSDSNRRDSTTGASFPILESPLEFPSNAEDCLMSITSISPSEQILSEATNDFLLRERSTNNGAGHNILMECLISRAPSTENTEATNLTIVGGELVEENNNTIKAEKIETDDVKLMQEMVVHPITMSRSIHADHESNECEHKEKPIDREEDPTDPAMSTSAFRTTMLAHADSVATTVDDSDYKTVSQGTSDATTTPEADLDSNPMHESLPSLASLDSYACNEEEYCSLHNEGGVIPAGGFQPILDASERSKPSPELDEGQLRFAEQPRDVTQQSELASSPEGIETETKVVDNLGNCESPSLISFVKSEGESTIVNLTQSVQDPNELASSSVDSHHMVEALKTALIIDEYKANPNLDQTTVPWLESVCSQPQISQESCELVSLEPRISQESCELVSSDEDRLVDTENEADPNLVTVDGPLSENCSGWPSILEETMIPVVATTAELLGCQEVQLPDITCNTMTIIDPDSLDSVTVSDAQIEQESPPMTINFEENQLSSVETVGLTESNAYGLAPNEPTISCVESTRSNVDIIAEQEIRDSLLEKCELITLPSVERSPRIEPPPNVIQEMETEFQATKRKQERFEALMSEENLVIVSEADRSDTGEITGIDYLTEEDDQNGYNTILDGGEIVTSQSTGTAVEDDYRHLGTISSYYAALHRSGTPEGRRSPVPLIMVEMQDIEDTIEGECIEKGLHGYTSDRHLGTISSFYAALHRPRTLEQRRHSTPIMVDTQKAEDTIDASEHNSSGTPLIAATSYYAALHRSRTPAERRGSTPIIVEPQKAVEIIKDKLNEKEATASDEETLLGMPPVTVSSYYASLHKPRSPEERRDSTLITIDKQEAEKTVEDERVGEEAIEPSEDTSSGMPLGTVSSYYAALHKSQTLEERRESISITQEPKEAEESFKDECIEKEATEAGEETILEIPPRTVSSYYAALNRSRTSEERRSSTSIAVDTLQAEETIKNDLIEKEVNESAEETSPGTILGAVTSYYAALHRSQTPEERRGSIPITVETQDVEETIKIECIEKGATSSVTPLVIGSSYYAALHRSQTPEERRSSIPNLVDTQQALETIKAECMEKDPTKSGEDPLYGKPLIAASSYYAALHRPRTPEERRGSIPIIVEPSVVEETVKDEYIGKEVPESGEETLLKMPPGIVSSYYAALQRSHALEERRDSISITVETLEAEETINDKCIEKEATEIGEGTSSVAPQITGCSYYAALHRSQTPEDRRSSKIIMAETQEAEETVKDEYIGTGVPESGGASLLEMPPGTVSSNYAALHRSESPEEQRAETREAVEKIKDECIEQEATKSGEDTLSGTPPGKVISFYAVSDRSQAPEDRRGSIPTTVKEEETIKEEYIGKKATESDENTLCVIPLGTVSSYYAALHRSQSPEERRGSISITVETQEAEETIKDECIEKDATESAEDTSSGMPLGIVSSNYAALHRSQTSEEQRCSMPITVEKRDAEETIENECIEKGATESGHGTLSVMPLVIGSSYYAALHRSQTPQERRSSIPNSVDTQKAEETIEDEFIVKETTVSGEETLPEMVPGTVCSYYAALHRSQTPEDRRGSTTIIAETQEAEETITDECIVKEATKSGEDTSSGTQPGTVTSYYAALNRSPTPEDRRGSISITVEKKEAEDTIKDECVEKEATESGEDTSSGMSLGTVSSYYAALHKSRNPEERRDSTPITVDTKQGEETMEDECIIKEATESGEDTLSGMHLGTVNSYYAVLHRSRAPEERRGSIPITVETQDAEETIGNECIEKGATESGEETSSITPIVIGSSYYVALHRPRSPDERCASTLITAETPEAEETIKDECIEKEATESGEDTSSGIPLETVTSYYAALYRSRAPEERRSSTPIIVEPQEAEETIKDECIINEVSESSEDTSSGTTLGTVSSYYAALHGSRTPEERGGSTSITVDTQRAEEMIRVEFLTKEATESLEDTSSGAPQETVSCDRSPKTDDLPTEVATQQTVEAFREDIVNQERTDSGLVPAREYLETISCDYSTLHKSLTTEDLATAVAKQHAAEFIIEGLVQKEARSRAQEEQHRPTPIAVVTQQMRQYCEELRSILYPNKPEAETPDRQEALQFFEEEPRVASEDLNKDTISNLLEAQENMSQVEHGDEEKSTILEDNREIVGKINTETWIGHSSSLPHLNDQLITADTKTSNDQADLSQLTISNSLKKGVEKVADSDNETYSQKRQLEHEVSVHPVLAWLSVVPNEENALCCGGASTIVKQHLDGISPYTEDSTTATLAPEGASCSENYPSTLVCTAGDQITDDTIGIFKTPSLDVDFLEAEATDDSTHFIEATSSNNTSTETVVDRFESTGTQPSSLSVTDKGVGKGIADLGKVPTTTYLQTISCDYFALHGSSTPEERHSPPPIENETYQTVETTDDTFEKRNNEQDEGTSPIVYVETISCDYFALHNSPIPEDHIEEVITDQDTINNNPQIVTSTHDTVEKGTDPGENTSPRIYVETISYDCYALHESANPDEVHDPPSIDVTPLQTTESIDDNLIEKGIRDQDPVHFALQKSSLPKESQSPIPVITQLTTTDDTVEKESNDLDEDTSPHVYVETISCDYFALHNSPTTEESIEVGLQQTPEDIEGDLVDKSITEQDITNCDNFALHKFPKIEDQIEVGPQQTAEIFDENHVKPRIDVISHQTAEIIDDQDLMNRDPALQESSMPPEKRHSPTLDVPQPTTDNTFDASVEKVVNDLDEDTSPRVYAETISCDYFALHNSPTPEESIKMVPLQTAEMIDEDRVQNVSTSGIRHILEPTLVITQQIAETITDDTVEMAIIESDENTSPRIYVETINCDYHALHESPALEERPNPPSIEVLSLQAAEIIDDCSIENNIIGQDEINYVSSTLQEPSILEERHSPLPIITQQPIDDVTIENEPVDLDGEISPLVYVETISCDYFALHNSPILEESIEVVPQQTAEKIVEDHITNVSTSVIRHSPEPPVVVTQQSVETVTEETVENENTSPRIYVETISCDYYALHEPPTPEERPHPPSTDVVSQQTKEIVDDYLIEKDITQSTTETTTDNTIEKESDDQDEDTSPQVYVETISCDYFALHNSATPEELIEVLPQQTVEITDEDHEPTSVVTQQSTETVTDDIVRKTVIDSDKNTSPRIYVETISCDNYALHESPTPEEGHKPSPNVMIPHQTADIIDDDLIEKGITDQDEITCDHSTLEESSMPKKRHSSIPVITLPTAETTTEDTVEQESGDLDEDTSPKVYVETISCDYFALHNSPTPEERDSPLPIEVIPQQTTEIFNEDELEVISALEIRQSPPPMTVVTQQGGETVAEKRVEKGTSPPSIYVETISCDYFALHKSPTPEDQQSPPLIAMEPQQSTELFDEDHVDKVATSEDQNSSLPMAVLIHQATEYPSDDIVDNFSIDQDEDTSPRVYAETITCDYYALHKSPTPDERHSPTLEATSPQQTAEIKDDLVETSVTDPDIIPGDIYIHTISCDYSALHQSHTPEERHSPPPIAEQNEVPTQTYLDIIKRDYSTLHRSRTPEDGHHPPPIAVVTQQMRQYCEELKSILYPQNSALKLLIHPEDLPVANEDLPEAEFKAHSGSSIQTVPCGEQISMPLEASEVKMALYNQNLRNLEYLEEQTNDMEVSQYFHTEIASRNIAEMIPSVKEHAVQEAIRVSNTPTPEPVATLVYQQPVDIVETTTSWEEIQEINVVDHSQTEEPTVSQTDHLQTSHVEKIQVSRWSSSANLYTPTDTAEQLQTPLEDPEISKDSCASTPAPYHVQQADDNFSELSSLSVSLTPVCALTNHNYSTNYDNNNNNNTNPTITDTNTSTEPQQPSPSFVSEACFLVTDPDSSQSQQLPAQSEPIHHQTSSELANGHDDDETTDETLIPGSIAEREHLKWRNASPIPNNPYSPDILQRRLTESGRKSSLFELDRSATNSQTPPKTPTPVEPLDSTKDEEGDVTEADRSLQSVLGDKPAQYRRYGRDYYINDAKTASGSRKAAADSGVPAKLSHSTDDEKSLLLSQQQQQDQPSSLRPKVSSPSHNNSKQQQPLGAFPFVKSSSVGNVIPATRTEDIFSAGRPVEVAPDDPVLKKGTKLDYLSSPTREVYLVPADEPITPRSHESSSEPSMASRPDESLTFSEDSDVTRIYEIGTGEAKVMHGNVIDSATPVTAPCPGTSTNEETKDENESNSKEEEILETIPQINATPTESDSHSAKSTSPVLRRNSVLKTFHAQAKPLAPSTIKFFSPKPFTGSAGSLAGSSPLSMSTTEVRDLPQQPPKHHHSSLHIDFPASRNLPSHDFTIEKEVMEVLPSVKELAKCYSRSQQDVSEEPRAFVKPKEFIRQSTDMLHEEQQSEPRSGMPSVQNKNRRMYCSASNIGAVDEIRRLNLETYNKPTYILMAPGHSITARSLSKQIREELKTNVTDDNKVHVGHASPERPSSPVFPPGHLRNSIQFFENLSSK
ncbi:uncharacterized protein LOC129771390 isoform X3 [Toxorhynchites rutilus septentrionalis]|uniref:uncharacterized protein LOC129771390 isoform X3 n=1 Tax=Toxorhynchites rutilus septentrionalis TaxID=329112 RepID=UPI0024784BA4|nr:uncharacterized protein LOC129771390 isoform X3 [Toxorhynchites rutilus septentrionalis]